MVFTMDRNRSGSPASICLASHAPGSTLSFTAIAFFSFDLDVAITKDHAMAVLISRRHASTSGNSYTTPMDATERLRTRRRRPFPVEKFPAFVIAAAIRHHPADVVHDCQGI
jgi:hypothetical protein